MKTLGIPLMLVLIGISAIGPMALNGVLPATTAVMSDLDTRFEVVQMLLTVFLVAALLSQLVLGPAADRYGRRPVMLVSLVVFCIGSVACAFAVSIEWLLVARFVQGIGGAVCVFLPRTVVRDIYSQNKAASVIGYITTAMMIAPLFAPALGGWITDQYSWRYLYLGLAGLSLVLIVMSYMYQQETLGINTKQGGLSNETSRFFSSSAILLREPAFRACCIMQAGTVGVYYSFLSGAPYVAMDSRGMSASSYGIWFAMVATGYLSGNFIAGKFSEKRGVFAMVALGAIPGVLGTLFFWSGMFNQHPVTLFLPMFLIALSNGTTLPSMFSIAMSIRPDLAASASGLSGSLQTGSGVLLSILIGLVLPYSDLWLFLIITLSTAVALLGLMRTLRLQHAHTEHGD